MTPRTKTHRNWRRAGRCLGLILGMLWLAGCAAYSQDRGEAAREKSFQETMRSLQAGQQEAIKLNSECGRQLRIGMSTAQVAALSACKNIVRDGQLMAWNTVVTAAGTMHQVRLGDGYLYFQNYVLVTIQR